MRQKIMIVFAILLLAVLFTSCGIRPIRPIEELMRPPVFSQEDSALHGALQEAVNLRLEGDEKRKVSIVYKQPKKGEYNTAVVKRDLNADGRMEAIAFYVPRSALLNMQTNVQIAFLSAEEDGEWTCLQDEQGNGTDVEFVRFCDFDGNGTQEILVGWRVTQNSVDTKFTLYDLDYSRENTPLKSLVTRDYQTVDVLDADADGIDEIFFSMSDSMGTPERNFAAALDYAPNTPTGIQERPHVALDTRVFRYIGSYVNKLNDGRTVVLLDGQYGANQMLTEVVSWNAASNGFTAAFSDPKTRVNSKTCRDILLPAQDFDGDGLTDIPTQYAMLGSKTPVQLIRWNAVAQDLTLQKIQDDLLYFHPSHSICVQDFFGRSVTADRADDENIVTLLVYAWDADTKRRGEQLLTLTWDSAATIDALTYTLTPYAEKNGYKPNIA
ncbi:MAG: hypothetical protein LBB67_05945 [Oscillospiraceae bacterium]|jgi:hypothetical protein|nr:hypothetical protein [Oscillospiraceae bacterium]